MKLLFKFNLVFLLLFILGIAACGYITRDLLKANAREEIRENARLMMSNALAVRSYTIGQIKPLLDTQMKYTFLPQTVPAYSATEVMNDLRKKYPEYAYKEAMLNPTNPRDRAVDWEADLINQFRNGGASGEIFGERLTPTGGSLYFARPLKIGDPACLLCHSTVEIAPRTMVDKYGPANGFGWNLNEVVGAQVVSVPTAVPLARAERAFRTFMISLAGVLVTIGFILNLLLYWIFIRPVTRISKLADRVSLGELDAADLNVRSGDEIQTLAESLARMRKSMQQAIQLLGS
jgi:methyl-accepting chemotaxis protein